MFEIKSKHNDYTLYYHDFDREIDEIRIAKESIKRADRIYELFMYSGKVFELIEYREFVDFLILHLTYGCKITSTQLAYRLFSGKFTGSITDDKKD